MHDLAFLTGDWITEEKTGLLFSNFSYETKYKWWDFHNNNDNDADYCPYCGEFLEVLGGYWDLAECPNCHTVVDVSGNVVVDGFYQSF